VVSTRVTPSRRSLPEMGNSTSARGCLRHPEINAARNASEVAIFREDRVMIWRFFLMPGRLAMAGWRRFPDIIHNDSVCMPKVSLPSYRCCSNRFQLLCSKFLTALPSLL
jgi:hypothetical protein